MTTAARRDRDLRDAHQLDAHRLADGGDLPGRLADQLDAVRRLIARQRADGATVVRLDAITALIGPDQAAARARLAAHRDAGWCGTPRRTP